MKISLLLPNPAARLWLYRVALATLALLVGYHLIDAGQVPLWITLAGAVLVAPTPVVAISALKQQINQGTTR